MSEITDTPIVLIFLTLIGTLMVIVSLMYFHEKKQSTLIEPDNEEFWACLDGCQHYETILDQKSMHHSFFSACAEACYDEHWKKEAEK